MSWPCSTRAKAAMDRFEAALSESAEAHERARKVATEVAAWADREREKIEADRLAIQRRSALRVQIGASKSGLAPAIDALKLAERRS